MWNCTGQMKRSGWEEGRWQDRDLVSAFQPPKHAFAPGPLQPGGHKQRSAVAHWHMKATPLPTTRAASSSEPSRVVGPAATISPAATSTLREAGEGEPTWAHGKTEGQAWGSRDIEMVSLSG